jgi:hypothetical protein
LPFRARGERPGDESPDQFESSASGQGPFARSGKKLEFPLDNETPARENDGGMAEPFVIRKNPRRAPEAKIALWYKSAWSVSGGLRESRFLDPIAVSA